MPIESAPRAWQLVLSSIEADLQSGRLGPGERIPPERELATRLGVGRSSVREALRVLEVLGVIRTGTGSGPTSGAIIVAAPRGGLSALLRLQVAAHGFPFADVMRTRLILETAVVAALADDAHRDLSATREVLQAMDAGDLSPADFLALDARLHLALAEASGNVVVAGIMEGLRTAIESYVLAGAATLSDWDTTSERLRAEHRAIVEAIERGDGPHAQRLVREHISGYYTEAAPMRAGERAW